MTENIQVNVHHVTRVEGHGNIVVDVRDGTLYIHTNDDHVNCRLATASLDNPGEWTTLIAGSDEFYLDGFELFKDFYVTEGRLRGLDQIQLRSYADPNLVKPIAFTEASFSTGLSNNPEYDQDKLRLTYESMVTPDSVYYYHVGSGELELLKQHSVDLIISDQVMPGMNGFQATRELSRDPRTARIPVLMVTTKGDETDRIWGMRQGAADYLVKPITEAQLVERVKAVLEG